MGPKRTKKKTSTLCKKMAKALQRNDIKAFTKHFDENERIKKLCNHTDRKVLLVNGIEYDICQHCRHIMGDEFVSDRFKYLINPNSPWRNN